MLGVTLPTVSLPEPGRATERLETSERLSAISNPPARQDALAVSNSSSLSVAASNPYPPG